jgi:hypothetical protein
VWLYVGCFTARFSAASGHPPDACVDEKMLAEWRDEHAAWRAIAARKEAPQPAERIGH